jgi:hypothetical protein
LTVATNLIYTDTVNSRVGIGTTTPDRPLHINSSGTLGLRIDVTGGGSNAIFLGATSSLIRWSNGAYFSNTGMYSQTNDQQYITFDGTNTQVRLQIKASNGNIGINTTTDSGFRLDVNGTARIQNQLTTTGSITAASAIARGVYMNNTLVAAANGDVLVGLDINPTFTTGIYTGTTSRALRVTGNIGLVGTPTFFGQTIFNDAVYFGGQVIAYAFRSNASIDFTFRKQDNTIFATFFNSTGNVTLQNGGTFTDAGFRLDVVGADSRFNGIRAGLGAGQVAGNTVFGNGALGSNVSGNEITAIGYQALLINTANQNTAVGYASMQSNTTGASNTAIGRQALLVNSTGSFNAAFGRDSLWSNTSGSSNMAIGVSALRLNTTGSNNVGIGFTSLLNNTASNNTAIGHESALTNTSGTGITAIGYQALTASTGANNTAVGFQSLSAHTTGANNTALGHLTASGNFSGCLILGKDATATANNQFVVGSSSINAGAVITETNTSSQVWNVIINGVARKILLA